MRDTKIMNHYHGDPLFEAVAKYHHERNHASTGSIKVLKRSITPDPQYRHLIHQYSSPRSTQILDRYPEFRLGHGDPLLWSVLQQHRRLLHERAVADTKRRISLSTQDKKALQLHMETPTSAACGLNDIVHMEGGEEVLSVPVVPGKIARPVTPPPPLPPQWHLETQGSPYCGMNDVVHLQDGEVVSVPMLPPNHE